VGINVVGPKRLPGMMRAAGRWVARLRRMSMHLRSQSGIDDLLR
jgi:sec-independent protein translocase protein TatB